MSTNIIDRIIESLDFKIQQAKYPSKFNILYSMQNAT
jgi:hypothetical protein